MFLNSFVGFADLNTVYENLLAHWVGPAFLIVLICLAVVTFAKQQIRRGIMLLVMAILVAVLIFFAPNFFGKDGVFTKLGVNFGHDVGESSGGGYGSVSQVYDWDSPITK